MHKKKGSFGYATCQDMAMAIVDNIADDNGVIEKVELAQMGQGPPEKAGFFLNIYLTEDFIQAQIRTLYTHDTIQMQEDDSVFSDRAAS